jgi:hypothetical protein
MLKLCVAVVQLLSHFNQCSVCGQTLHRMSFHVFRQGDTITILPANILPSYSGKPPDIILRSDFRIGHTRLCCLQSDKRAIASFLALYGSAILANGYQGPCRTLGITVILDRKHQGVEEVVDVCTMMKRFRKSSTIF